MRERGERPSLGDQYVELESISVDYLRAELQELELAKAAHFRLVKAHRRVTDWCAARHEKGESIWWCVRSKSGRLSGLVLERRFGSHAR